MIEKEFMIAKLRKQRDLLNDLVSKISEKNELEKGTRLFYDQVTKHVEQNLKELKQLRKTYYKISNKASYQFNFDPRSNKQSADN